MTPPNRGSVVRRGTERITPRAAAPMAGYASRGAALAEGSHDDLEATLVVWSGAGDDVAWLAIDAIAVTARLRGALVDAVLDGLGDPSITVLVCASHTHSAPLGWTGDIHPGLRTPPDEALLAELLAHVGRLAGRVRAAPAIPVEPRWITDTVIGVGANRHRPAGPHDTSAGLLALVGDETGAAEAVVVDYACHPTVLPAANLQWSADWPGAARRVVRAALQAASGAAGATTDPSIVFLQGAAGDSSARFVRRSADFAEAARLGAIFAGSAVALAERADEVRGGLRAHRRTIGVDTRSLPDPATAQALVARCEADRAAAGPDTNDPRTRQLQTRLEGARVQLALATASPPTTAELPVSIVTLGRIAWVHVPLELFASLALAIKDGSPYDDTRVVGYTDGYFGYLADRDAHLDGTYEALSSLFDADAADAFVAAVIAELHRAHTTEGQP